VVTHSERVFALDLVHVAYFGLYLFQLASVRPLQLLETAVYNHFQVCKFSCDDAVRRLLLDFGLNQFYVGLDHVLPL